MIRGVQYLLPDGWSGKGYGTPITIMQITNNEHSYKFNQNHPHDLAFFRRKAEFCLDFSGRINTLFLHVFFISKSIIQHQVQHFLASFNAFFHNSLIHSAFIHFLQIVLSCCLIYCLLQSFINSFSDFLVILSVAESQFLYSLIYF